MMLFGAKEISIFDAHELYLEGKYDKAVYLCEQILAVNPDSYSALNIIANVKFIQGDFEKGELYIYKLRDYFMRKKESDKAVAVLKRLVKARPQETKYFKDIADIYLKSGKTYRYFCTCLRLADVYKRNGRFKKSADIYVELAEVICRPELIMDLVEKLKIISATDQIGQIAEKYIFGNTDFTPEQQDDITILCSHTGCRPEYFIKSLSGLLSRDPGWIDFVEKDIFQYFSEHKDDELFREIISYVKNPENIIDAIREAAPENLPDNELESLVEDIAGDAIEEAVEAEAESVLVIPQELKIETHRTEETAEIELAPLELDSFLPETNETTVRSEISGLETFEVVEDDVKVVPIELDDILDFDTPSKTVLMDSFKDEPVEENKSDDIFASFDTDKNMASDGDIFAVFDEPESSKSEEVEKIDMSDVEIDDKLSEDDFFADLIEEKTEEPEDVVEKIDMSDIETPVKKEEDIFEKEL